MTNSLYFIFPDHLLICPETFPHSEHTSASILTTAYWLFEYWFLILTIFSYWLNSHTDFSTTSLLHLYVSTSLLHLYISTSLLPLTFSLRCRLSIQTRCFHETARLHHFDITFSLPCNIYFLSSFSSFSILFISFILSPSFYLLFISFILSPSFFLLLFFSFYLHSFLFWRFAPVPPARSKPSAPQMGRL